MLAELVKQKLGDYNLTIREAAKAAGVSHTTLARVVNGVPVDIETLVRVCDWLGVTPAEGLNSMALRGNDKLVASIALLVEAEPGLATMFREALADVEKGNINPQDVQEIISYAAYRLAKGKAKLST